MKKVTIKTQLLCPRCRTITPIFRKEAKQRKEGHYKNFYCYVCKSTHNHIELKLNKYYTEEEKEKLIEQMKTDNKYDYV